MKSEILIAGLSCAALITVSGRAKHSRPGPIRLHPLRRRPSPLSVGKAFDDHPWNQFQNRMVVMSGGKIIAVGAAKTTRVPAGAEVFDAKGMTVYPGLFDAETNLGLTEVAADQNSNDLAENPLTSRKPQMRSCDSIPRRKQRPRSP